MASHLRFGACKQIFGASQQDAVLKRPVHTARGHWRLAMPPFGKCPGKTETIMIDVDGPPLVPQCAICGADLMLTPSGHPFCIDPVCPEGFGVDILRQLFGGAPAVRPIISRQKPRSY